MISVIIPTYNRVDLLKRAIKSIQNQTYKDIEIIIVSDGSTDNTKEFVRSVMKFDNRISFFDYFPSKGANIARNIGIEKAKGEYISFLDDDDEWLPTKLEDQLKIFNYNKKIGLVYTGINIIYIKEKISYTSLPNEEGNLSDRILIDNVIGTTSSVIIKAEILKEVGIFDVNLNALQDWDLWIRICQKTEVGVVKKCLINYYNYTDKKQISSNTLKYEESIRYIELKYKDYYKNLDNKSFLRKKFCDYKLLANKNLRNNNKKIARKYCFEAMKYHFNIILLYIYILSFFDFKVSLKLRKLKDKFIFYLYRDYIIK